MDTSLIDLDRVPTLEELRKFFQNNDWSAAKISEPLERSSDTNELIQYVKHLMDEHFEPISHEMGLKKLSNCYDKNHPLITLRDSTKDLVASKVAELIEEKPEIAVQILEHFDLDDPDIDKNADNFLQNAVEKMLKVMDYDAVADIVNNAPEHKDFSSLENNHPKQDFDRNYYKTRTKHPLISLDELTEGGNESALHNSDYIAEQNVENSKEAVRAFWNTLSKEDKKLLLFRMNGMTYKEIAAEMNFKTHSAVLKRRRKIEEQFIEFFKKYT